MSANVIKLTPSALAALLCSRVCHDLINPVGMVNTGLEVLDDESNTDMHADAIDLIRNASRQANAKLNFLRDAFGAAGSAPGIFPLEDLQKKTMDMYADSKATLNWQLSVDGLEKSKARLLMNMVMIAVNAIPRGGDVVISGTESQLKLVATGRKAGLKPEIEKALNGKTPEDGFDGRSIQPFYAGMIARELGGTLSHVAEEDSVTFTANFS